MDVPSEALVLAAIALVVGVLSGMVLRRASGRRQSARIRELETDLATSREELERYRGQVAEHFTQTSRLLRDLTLQYRSVYEHLADGARTLCPEGTPLLDRSLAEAALPEVAPAPEPEDGSDNGSPPEAARDAAPADSELDPILDPDLEAKELQDEERP
jgi:uncharacterized protein